MVLENDSTGKENRIYYRVVWGSALLVMLVANEGRHYKGDCWSDMGPLRRSIQNPQL